MPNPPPDLLHLLDDYEARVAEAVHRILRAEELAEPVHHKEGGRGHPLASVRGGQGADPALVDELARCVVAGIPRRRLVAHRLVGALADPGGEMTAATVGGKSTGSRPTPGVPDAEQAQLRSLAATWSQVGRRLSAPALFPLPVADPQSHLGLQSDSLFGLLAELFALLRAGLPEPARDRLLPRLQRLLAECVEEWLPDESVDSRPEKNDARLEVCDRLHRAGVLTQQDAAATAVRIGRLFGLSSQERSEDETNATLAAQLLGAQRRRRAKALDD